MMRTRLLSLLLLPSLLTGCINVGIGAKTKVTPNLLTLVPIAMRGATPEQTPTADQAVSIAQPLTPQWLGYNRIPVQSASGRITYLVDANWVEPPAALFRGLLTEVVSNKMGRVVIDPRELPIVTGTRLSGQLIAFGVDDSSREAVVVYDALLVRKGTVQVASRRFTARVPLATVNGAQAGAALNVAANQVAAEVAEWIGRSS